MVGNHDWLIGGDFNAILHHEGRERIGDFDQVGENEFNDAMEGLIKLDHVGGAFT